MSDSPFPEMLTRLPLADIPLPNVTGRLMQAGEQQLVFFDIQPGAEIPLHSHCAQWGIVVGGELELTIGGVTKTYKKGDSYFIPDGVEHGAKLTTRVQVIDIFDEPARYKPRP